MAGRHNYPYTMRVNVPAWVLQIIICVTLLGICGYVLSITRNDKHLASNIIGIELAAAGIFVGISSLTLLFDLFEIILIARKNMAPGLYLTFACIKTLIWAIILIVEASGAAAAGSVLAAIVFVTSLVQLFQGAYIVNGKRQGKFKGGKYEPALNPVAPGSTETAYGTPQYYSGNAYNPGPEVPLYTGYKGSEMPVGGNAPRYDMGPDTHELASLQ